MSLQDCSIGQFEGTVCHKTVHTHGKIGIKNISEIFHGDIELLIWRTGIQKKHLRSVCLHHLKQYLDKFTTLNTFCCDPFEHHAEKKNFKGNF